MPHALGLFPLQPDYGLWVKSPCVARPSSRWADARARSRAHLESLQSRWAGIVPCRRGPSGALRRCISGSAVMLLPAHAVGPSATTRTWATQWDWLLASMRSGTQRVAAHASRPGLPCPTAQAACPRTPRPGVLCGRKGRGEPPVARSLVPQAVGMRDAGHLGAAAHAPASARYSQ